MKKSLILSLLSATLLTGNAFASEVPDFLSKGQTYATDWKACVGFADGGAPDDSNTLDKNGIFGYEFGCTFVEFKPVIFEGRTTGHLITASCGDDSGINRPDIFDVYVYDNIVTATSQNDYIYDTLRQREDGDGASWGFINKQFEMCQPE
jgi:hypothetical protein